MFFLCLDFVFWRPQFFTIKHVKIWHVFLRKNWICKKCRNAGNLLCVGIDGPECTLKVHRIVRRERKHFDEWNFQNTKISRMSCKSPKKIWENPFFSWNPGWLGLAPETLLETPGRNEQHRLSNGDSEHNLFWGWPSGRASLRMKERRHDS